MLSTTTTITATTNYILPTVEVKKTKSQKVTSGNIRFPVRFDLGLQFPEEMFNSGCIFKFYLFFMACNTRLENANLGCHQRWMCPIKQLTSQLVKCSLIVFQWQASYLSTACSILTSAIFALIRSRVANVLAC